MAGETTITVVGNLTSDPELRYTQNGLAVANFTVASTPRTFDRQKNEWVDGEPMFLRASVWREFAEHVAASLTKGARVIVRGNLKQRSYETKPDAGGKTEKRTSFELEVDEIGPSLRYATAEVTRTSSSGSRAVGGEQTYKTPEDAARAAQQNQGGQQQGQAAWGQPGRGASNEEPWGSPPPGGTYNDETPF